MLHFGEHRRGPLARQQAKNRQTLQQKILRSLQFRPDQSLKDLYRFGARDSVQAAISALVGEGRIIESIVSPNVRTTRTYTVAVEPTGQSQDHPGTNQAFSQNVYPEDPGKTSVPQRGTTSTNSERSSECRRLSGDPDPESNGRANLGPELMARVRQAADLYARRLAMYRRPEQWRRERNELPVEDFYKHDAWRANAVRFVRWKDMPPEVFARQRYFRPLAQLVENAQELGVEIEFYLDAQFYWFDRWFRRPPAPWELASRSDRPPKRKRKPKPEKRQWWDEAAAAVSGGVRPQNGYGGKCDSLWRVRAYQRICNEEERDPGGTLLGRPIAHQELMPLERDVDADLADSAKNLRRIADRLGVNLSDEAKEAELLAGVWDQGVVCHEYLRARPAFIRLVLEEKVPGVSPQMVDWLTGEMPSRPTPPTPAPARKDSSLRVRRRALANNQPDDPKELVANVMQQLRASPG